MSIAFITVNSWESDLPIQSLTSAEIIKFHNSSNTTPSQESSSIFGEDGFTFGDILDIVNPLQHIPVVSSIYRKITGDIIAPSMQIAGDALFGGPIGAAISIAKEAIKSQFNNSSADPDSPSIDSDPTTINPETIVNGTSPQFPRTISSADYSATSDSLITQSTVVKQALDSHIVKHHNGSIGAAISLSQANTNNNKGITIENTKELYASNTLPRKPVYLPTDGLMHLVQQSTEIYKNVVSSTKPPASSIDIVIGSG
jgi:hypothetical protein